MFEQSADADKCLCRNAAMHFKGSAGPEKERKAPREQRLTFLKMISPA
jgi:hypothetical protein